MSNFIDLTGQRFGKLVVLKRSNNYIQPSGQQKTQWLCKCDCGNEVIVRGHSLKHGDTKSCGCLNSKKVIERNKNNNKKNIYDLSGEYGIGYTFKGEEFYFDLEDYDKIKNYYWQITKKGYVVSSKNELHERVNQHRIIMNCPEGLEVDHIHSDKKNDNRKSNLRICIHMENSMNRSIRTDNKSGVTGVIKEGDKWVAMITSYGKKRKKRFSNFLDAVNQRKEWEEQFFLEFGYDNSQKKEVI